MEDADKIKLVKIGTDINDLSHIIYNDKTYCGKIIGNDFSLKVSNFYLRDYATFTPSVSNLCQACLQTIIDIDNELSTKLS